jgi:hypothetical protein
MANIWRAANDSPPERLKASRIELAKYLEGTGIPGLCERIAIEFADSIGATKKFVDFLIEYLPEPPEKRPPAWAHVNWSRDDMRAAFTKIYAQRSLALHAGIPFPWPMCQPPIKYEPSWEAVEERQTATAVSAYGGTWSAKDLPMLLHTFEYIARRVLNSWWSSAITDHSV